jgi:beta-galactosidase
VYSNCDEVQLTVNGKKLDRKKMPLNGHLEWTAVYKPGSLKAVGYKEGKKVMETSVATTGEAVKEVWTTETVGDIMVANVSLTDSKGRFVPTASQEVTYTAPEGWTILGWGNGDPAFQYVERPVIYGVSATDGTTASDGTSLTGTPAPDQDARSIRIRTFNGLAQVILQKIRTGR